MNGLTTFERVGIFVCLLAFVAVLMVALWPWEAL